MDHRTAGIDQELALFRERINRIDEQLIGLLAARYAVVYATLALKRAHGVPALDKWREDEIALRAEARATGKLPGGIARQVMQSIVDVLRDEAAYALGWYARD